MKKQRIAALLLFIFLPGACASLPHAADPKSGPEQRFSFEHPSEWERMNTQRYLIFTKDGAFSQYILIQERPIHKAFRHTKRRFTRDMLPQETAEVIVDEISSDRSVLHFRILENGPATVGGIDGFRLVFTYKSKDGRPFKTVYYGCLQGAWFYSIRYNADERHFCTGDIDTLERILGSFRIAPSGEA